MMTDIATRNVFRTLFFLILAGAGICSLAVPVSAYEEDTHFLITYVVCKSAGFTHEEALTVAAVNQGMDDSKAVNAHDGGKPQIEEEWRWHALDLNGQMHAAGIIARRDLLFKEALEESDPEIRLIRLGIFFHYQQDSWAHRHHEKSNHLSRDNFTTFNTPTGHGPWGSKPDRPPLDPVAAFMSLEDGIVFAMEFLEESLGRKPNGFLAGYKPASGSVDEKWKDRRKGKFFNQIDLSGDKPDTAGYYLKSLIAAQINAYQRSRDYNPFYAPKRTPDKADFDTVRANLQEVCDTFASNLGKIVIPSKDEKVAQGFNSMTTDGLLNLGSSNRDR